MGPRLSKCFTRKYDYEPNRKSEDDEVRYRNADDSVPVMRYETVSYIVPPADLKKLMEMTVDDEPTSSNTTRADGSVSKQDNDVTKENGTAIIQEGDSKQQDEDATKENGTATIQKGDAKQQDEDVTKVNGTDTIQEGDAKQQDEDATKENGTATIQEVDAKQQDEDLTKENGTATIQEGDAKQQYEDATKGNGTATIQEVDAKKQAEDVIIQAGVETEADGILVSKEVTLTGLNGDVKKEPDVETETESIVVTVEAADIDVAVQQEDVSLRKDDEIVAKDSIEETEATDTSKETDVKEIEVVDNTPIVARTDDVMVQENGIEGEVTRTTTATNKSEDKEEGEIDHVTSETKVALQTDKDSFVPPSSSIMPRSEEIGLASAEQTIDSDAER